MKKPEWIGLVVGIGFVLITLPIQYYTGEPPRILYAIFMDCVVLSAIVYQFVLPKGRVMYMTLSPS